MMKKPNCPIIAIEEHYWDRELAKHFTGPEAGRGNETDERLYDLGALRIKEMDEAGIDVQVLSHGAPSSQKLPIEIAATLTNTIAAGNTALDRIGGLDLTAVNFANTVRALDDLGSQLMLVDSRLGLIEQTSTNAALRDAAGSDVPIVGGTIYDPFLPYWLQGTDEGRDIAERSVAAIVGINGLEASIYGAFGIPVADVEGAFQTTMFTPVVPVDWYPVAVPLNVVRVCQWTWICSATHPGDFHPNAEGYGVIAAAYRAELGF